MTVAFDFFAAVVPLGSAATKTTISPAKRQGRRNIFIEAAHESKVLAHRLWRILQGTPRNCDLLSAGENCSEIAGQDGLFVGSWYVVRSQGSRSTLAGGL